MVMSDLILLWWNGCQPRDYLYHNPRHTLYSKTSPPDHFCHLGYNGFGTKIARKHGVLQDVIVLLCTCFETKRVLFAFSKQLWLKRPTPESRHFL